MAVKKKPKPKSKLKTVHVAGKRKRAIARATAKEGKGFVKINGKHLELYEPDLARMKIMEPLLLSGPIAKTVDIAIIIKGGGWSAQAEAARLAVAKALVEYSKSEELKRTFLKYDRGLLVADTRRTEPSKPNKSKPRKKRQKSYR